MSKTVLAQVDGFTPVIDGMVSEVGLIAAAVFGKAWRYCQMADGVCKAAQERIADELGLSRATVNTHLKRLCEAGYLQDTTPELVGVPHVYADTGKANLSISFTGVTATCQKDLQPPVKNFDTKKEIKKEIYTGAVIEKVKSFGWDTDTAFFELLTTWREIHPEDKILLAIDKSHGKNIKYADAILRGWEKDGYPQTRGERVKSANTRPEKSAAPAAITYDSAGIPETF